MRWHDRLQLISTSCAIFGLVVGGLALAGWFVGMPWLTGAVHATSIGLKTNGAIALVITAAALLFQQSGSGDSRARAGRWLALAAVTIGLLTLIEHVFGINLGLDQLFAHERPGAPGTVSPNRMGPPAALDFTLLGLALYWIDRAPLRGIRLTSALAWTAAAVAGLPLLGYLYGSEALYGFPRVTAVSFPMATALLALSAGVLLARPEHGVARLLCADDEGGTVARRLALPAVGLFVLLGWLRTVGERAHLYDSSFGVAVLVLSAIAGTMALVWWNAGLLHRLASARSTVAAAQRTLGDQLATVLETISQAFLAFDGQLRCTHLNGHASRILRGSPRDLIGRPLWEIFPGGPDTPVAVAARRALSEHVPITVEAEYPSLRLWCETDIVPHQDGVVVFAQDVSERRLREHERQELLESERAAREEAQRANRLKDEFLATVSHELRTPLNAILGWSQLLTRGVAGDQLAKGLSAIERNAKLQAQLIEDLLDVSRIISGKLRLNVQRVEIVPVIEAAIDTVRLAAETKGVRLSRQFDPEVNAVDGDPARLQQIVWNLLSNAVKFTPRGGDVHVALEAAGDRAVITVSDTGQGIRAEMLPQVFGRFWQADASSTRRHGGLGLGLAIVRHLVEQHGGTVTAESDGEDRGARFTVNLPRAAADIFAWNDAQVEPLPGLGGVDVLVVDDEPDTRELIRRILEERGAAVRDASSAVDALNLITDRRPDVLISDIGMPGADGYELIRLVRSLETETGTRIPAIALTAFARSEDRRRAFRAGFEMHLSKPVAPSELVAMVASLAGRGGSDDRAHTHSVA